MSLFWWLIPAYYTWLLCQSWLYSKTHLWQVLAVPMSGSVLLILVRS